MSIFSGAPVHRMTESACNFAPGCPRCRVSPWVRNAIAGTLPAPTLAPTQSEIDAELFERYRFAFRVRG